MTTLHLAERSHLEILEPMVAAFHAQQGISSNQEHRRRALLPLLEGSPYGVIYLMGPVASPLGYMTITFSWSVEFGGLDSIVDEIFLRERVRRRGIGTSALYRLTKVLSRHGVKSLALEVDTRNAAAVEFYKSKGFTLRDHYHLMVMAIDGALK